MASESLFSTHLGIWKWGVSALLAFGLTFGQNRTAVADESIETGGASAEEVESPPTVAQADGPDVAAGLRRAGRRDSIEEITVTARKREESVQDIPIAISAFTADDLETANIDDVADVQFNIPNVSFGKTNFGSATNFSIRGIGAVNIGSAPPATGIHLNSAPMAFRIWESEFYDVERLEVLRGPQGTLFGRNSASGALNMITRKPEEDFGGYIDATYGNYNTQKLKGALNIPLGERAGLRLAGFLLRRDGYTNNKHTGKDIDDRDIWSLRATLGVDITDNTRALLTTQWFKESDYRTRMQKQACKKDTRPFPTNIGCAPDALAFETPHGSAFLGSEGASLVEALATQFGLPPSVFPQYFGFYPFGYDAWANSINPGDMRKVAASIDPRYRSEEFLYTLDLSHDFGPVTLTALTGFWDLRTWSQTDYLWSVASEPFPGGEHCFAHGCFDRGFAYDQSSGKATAWSQELRLTSNFEGPFNFTLGALTLNEKNSGDYLVYADGLDVAAEFLGTFLFGVPEEEFDAFMELARQYRNNGRDTRVRSWAVFGEAYYDLTSSTRVSAGLRLTNDYRHRKGRITIIGVPGPFRHQKDDWREWTGRFVIDQRLDLPFTDETMAYASYARGYKGGGFNPGAQEGSEVPKTFEPEFINSYELGFKNRLFDNRLLLNLTGFFYNYDGLQVSKIVEKTSVNENIDAKGYGAELEAVAQVTDRLRFDLNGSYLRTRIGGSESIDTRDVCGGVPGYQTIKKWQDFTAGNWCIANEDLPAHFASGLQDTSMFFSGFPVNVKRNDLQHAPSWSFKVGAEYTLPVIDGYDMTFRIDHYWQDEMYGRIYNANADEIDSWAQTDSQITLRPQDGDWSVEVWVKNVFDSEDVTGMYLTDESSGMFTNLFSLEPRTYGVTVHVGF